MARVLVLSTDRVGERMAGPSIRCLEIARALTRAGHPAVLAVPQADPPAMDGVRIEPFRGLPHRELFESADLALIPGSLHLDPSVPIAIPMVLDLYDPFLLSGLDLPAARDPAGLAHFAAERDRLEAKVRRADLCLCASEKQRDFWLGVLAAWGRIEPLEYANDPDFARLLAVVPFGVPDEPPRPGPAARGRVAGIGAGDELLVWGGGIWNWFDPLTLIRAVAELARRRPRLRLLFLGVRHPNPLMPEMAMAVRATDLAAELGLTGRHVFFGDWVPYAQRGAYLLEADLGVSTHRPGIETRFAFRTRLLDSIWAGLPIVTTAGDLMADLVAGSRLGAVVPPADPGALAEAIDRLLADPGRRADCRARLGGLARAYRWSALIGPLDEFCRAVDAGRVRPRSSAGPEPARAAADPAAPVAGGGWLRRLARSLAR